jgi:hypothetical protein
MARSTVSGAATTFRLDAELMPIVEEGLSQQAKMLSRAYPKARRGEPSLAQWFRSLIRFSYSNRYRIADEAQRLVMDRSLVNDRKVEKIRTLLPDSVRIDLRKYEFHIQAMDWLIEFDRNAAVNHMVSVHGRAFNAFLESADLHDDRTKLMLTP